MLGYFRDLLGWDLLGYAWICWDILGYYASICWDTSIWPGIPCQSKWPTFWHGIHVNIWHGVPCQTGTVLNWHGIPCQMHVQQLSRFDMEPGASWNWQGIPCQNTWHLELIHWWFDMGFHVKWLDYWHDCGVLCDLTRTSMSNEQFVISK